MRIEFKERPQNVWMARWFGGIVYLLMKLFAKNRDRYFKRLGINKERVIAGGIVHGSYVAVVGEQETGVYLLNTDALITNIPNIF